MPLHDHVQQLHSKPTEKLQDKQIVTACLDLQVTSNGGILADETRPSSQQAVCRFSRGLFSFCFVDQAPIQTKTEEKK